MSAYPADHADPIDPTFSSNALTPKERAEHIRTTRRLAQVFCQPPGVSPVALEQGRAWGYPMPSDRPVASMPEDVAGTTPFFNAAGAVVWPPPDGTRYVYLVAHRRHSASLSPE